MRSQYLRKQFGLLIVINIFCTSNLLACWGYVPLEERLSDAHLVVTGKVTGNSGLFSSTRYSYLKVDKILKNDLAGYEVKPGDIIKLKLPSVSKKWSTYFEFKTGTSGLWMLRYSKHDFQASWPGVLARPYEIKTDKAAAILLEIRKKYKLALKDIIPAQEKYLKRLHNIPLCSKDKALKDMNKAIPPDVDLSKLYILGIPYHSLFINPKGEILSAIPYSGYGSFNEGFLMIASKNKWNYIDRNCKLLLKYFCFQIREFSEGLAAVRKLPGIGLYGYIDYSGRMWIPEKYAEASPFSGGMAVVRTRTGENLLIDKQGNIILKAAAIGSLKEGLALVRYSKDLYGAKYFVDNTGKTVLTDANSNEYRFELYSSAFHEGLCRVVRKKDGLYGFVNLKGELVIKPQFQQVGDFGGGFAACMVNGKWGFIDKKGKVVITPQYSRIVGSFASGLAGASTQVWVKRKEILSDDAKIKLSSDAVKYALADRYGFINKQGKWIVPPVFTTVVQFKPKAELTLVNIYEPRKNAPELSVLINKAGKAVFAIKPVRKWPAK